MLEMGEHMHNIFDRYLERLESNTKDHMHGRRNPLSPSE